MVHRLGPFLSEAPPNSNQGPSCPSDTGEFRSPFRSFFVWKGDRDKVQILSECRVLLSAFLSPGPAPTHFGRSLSHGEYYAVCSNSVPTLLFWGVFQFYFSCAFLLVGLSVFQHFQELHCDAWFHKICMDVMGSTPKPIKSTYWIWWVVWWNPSNPAALWCNFAFHMLHKLFTCRLLCFPASSRIAPWRVISQNMGGFDGYHPKTHQIHLLDLMGCGVKPIKSSSFVI